MTLLGGRVGLKYTCVVERNSNPSASNDAWGNPIAEDWETLQEDVPCTAWLAVGTETSTGERTIVTELRHISVPVGTDITELDRILVVNTRSGGVHFDGPMGIVSVTKYEDHIEIGMERVR